jgi:hypothetical protein
MILVRLLSSSSSSRGQAGIVQVVCFVHVSCVPCASRLGCVTWQASSFFGDAFRSCRIEGSRADSVPVLACLHPCGIPLCPTPPLSKSIQSTCVNEHTLGSMHARGMLRGASPASTLAEASILRVPLPQFLSGVPCADGSMRCAAALHGWVAPPLACGVSVRLAGRH